MYAQFEYQRPVYRCLTGKGSFDDSQQPITTLGDERLSKEVNVINCAYKCISS